MSRLTIEELRYLQAAVRESAEQFGFVPAYLADFDCVVRLTAEFRSFLADLAAGAVDAEKTRDRCDSVFSGIESFCGVSDCYRMISTEAADPIFSWGEMSFAKLNDQFAAKYERFLTETDFPVRCRLLLDLFKLQLVFTGMAYG